MFGVKIRRCEVRESIHVGLKLRVGGGGGLPLDNFKEIKSVLVHSDGI